ncbi:hypothetical protein [Streptomyces inhibens]|uniref:hypothetical protein n=1 Tax=Streptomyces inhibens TaxID=2293571 RepID=UPI0026B96155
MLGASAGLPRKARTAKTTSVAISTAPPTASSVETELSSAVSRLKCEGTRRHACTVIPATSAAQSAAKIPSVTDRSRPPMRRHEVSQVIVISVSPKDRPNVTGFRQETGPRQGPPIAPYGGRLGRHSGGSSPETHRAHTAGRRHPRIRGTGDGVDRVTAG